MATLHNITFDCRDAARLAEFWSAILDRPIADGASEHFAMLPGEPNFLFIQVPEVKVAKNRCHIDLDSADLASERERLEALGATFVHEKDEFGIHWITFQDPQGNEFCVGSH